MSDDLWERIEPLLPKRERRFRYPGRKPVPDRQVQSGIPLVLHPGVQWEHLPQELGFGSASDTRQTRAPSAEPEGDVEPRPPNVMGFQNERHTSVKNLRGVQPRLAPPLAPFKESAGQGV